MKMYMVRRGVFGLCGRPWSCRIMYFPEPVLSIRRVLQVQCVLPFWRCCEVAGWLERVCSSASVRDVGFSREIQTCGRARILPSCEPWQSAHVICTQMTDRLLRLLPCVLLIPSNYLTLSYTLRRAGARTLRCMFTTYHCLTRARCGSE